MEYLSINLTKHVEDIHGGKLQNSDERYQRRTKKKNGEVYHVHEQEDSTLSRCIFLKFIYIQQNLNKKSQQIIVQILTNRF